MDRNGAIEKIKEVVIKQATYTEVCALKLSDFDFDKEQSNWIKSVNARMLYNLRDKFWKEKKIKDYTTEMKNTFRTQITEISSKDTLFTRKQIKKYMIEAMRNALEDIQ